jgi:hypothetical protein
MLSSGDAGPRLTKIKLILQSPVQTVRLNEIKLRRVGTHDRLTRNSRDLAQRLLNQIYSKSDEKFLSDACR